MSRSSADADDPGRPDLRLVPVAGCLWAGAWCATSGGGWLVGAAAAFGAAMAALLVVRRRRGVPLLAFAGVGAGLAGCLVGGVAWWATGTGVVSGWAADGAVMDVQARVRGDPVTWPAHGFLPQQTVVPLRVSQIAARGQTVRLWQDAELVVTGEAPLLAVGQRIAVTARAGVPDPGSGLALALRQVGDLTVTAAPNPIDRAITGLRSGLHRAMSHSPPDQAGLVPSLVVGDTSALPQTVVEAFRATSLSHLVAVSGTNLTLMLGFALMLAKRCGARGVGLRVIAAVSVVGFVVLCRAEPSVLRAAAMGLVALVAIGAGGDSRRGFRHLSVAVIGLLLVTPWLAHSWGFALSAAATAGILWWAGPWQRALAAWAPAWLAEALCVPLAAQLATQPLVTALNGQVSLVGVFANLLAAPFVGPVTVLGLVVCLVAPLSPMVAVGIGWLAGWCAEPILRTAAVGSGLPGATLPVGTTAVGLVVVGLVSLAIATALRWALARGWAALACGAALVVIVAVPTPMPGWPGPWQVVFCDVGQGDAAVVRVGNGSAVLIDAGPDPPALHRCLDVLGVHALPLVIFTHQHADHVGGAQDLVRRYQVGQVMVRSGLSAAQMADLHDLLGEPAVPIAATAPGERLAVGPVTWTTVVTGAVFSLAADGEGEDSAENDAGIIGVAEVAGLRVLFTGDAEPSGQAAAVATGTGLGVDVLKVPHHGSSRQDEEFLADTRAAAAVVSVGVNNGYGHPTQRTLMLLQADGMRVWRTDQRGAIAVAKPDGIVEIRAERGPPP